MTVLEVVPISAFSDNYIWLVRQGQQAVVVDPGEAAPVLAALQAQALQLQAIVLTHHHGDHTGGVQALQQATGCTVYGPATEKLPEPVQRVRASQPPGGIALLGQTWQVLDVPGHTAGHIAWYLPQGVQTADGAQAPALFCGDTLFSGGCGRLFEGTAEQMHTSLMQLAALPAQTLVFCAHEYTLSNLRFAREVEPDNAALQQYEVWCFNQREKGLPTLPSTLAQELAINPFLRCTQAAVASAALRFDPNLHTTTLPPSSSSPTSVQVLAALRAWKNIFV